MWRLLREAAVFVQQILFSLAKRRRRSPKIRIVCLSDTHSQILAIPQGDVLIHAGDLSQSGHPDEIQQAISWLSSQPHKYKIVIAGNADLFLDKSATRIPRVDHSRHAIDGGLNWGDIRYLDRSTTTIVFEDHEASRSLTIYGDPNVPRCGPNGQEAFQYDADEDYWRDSIPSGTDILITHTPPKYILDEWNGIPEGCPSLLREVERTRPLLHVFGHIHPAAGSKRVIWGRGSTCSLLPIADAASPSIKVASRLGQVLRCLMRSTCEVACSWLSDGVEWGTFVNAACMSPDGKYLKNPPGVVDI